MKKTVYEIITEKIIEQLENGVVPWKQPWTSSAPRNLVSKKAYRGINPFMLALLGYTSPYWLSYKQCAALGGKVKKGEKATPVVFWMTKVGTEKDKKTGKDKAKKIFILRYYNVFNVEQCEGIEVPKDEILAFEPIEKCESIVAGFTNRPQIETSSEAYYSPSRDVVGVPAKSSFRSAPMYYSVLFHELVHSTGAESRLDRKIMGVSRFGSEDYSKEELVAEMGAAFLSAEGGIVNETIGDSAAYLKHWIVVLRNDSKLIVTAAAQAQKAADHILGRTYEVEAV